MGGFLTTAAEIGRQILESDVFHLLVSYQAQRVYAFVIALLIIAGGSLLALIPFRALHSETKYDSLEKRLTYRGKKPTTDEGKAKRRERIKSDARDYATCSLGRVSLIFLLGVIFPLMTVLTITAQSSWFFPEGYVLLDQASREPIRSPGLNQLVFFAFDLIAKGGLNDVVEVFDLSIGRTAHAPENRLFSGYVLAFRFVADLFVVSLAFYTFRTFWNWRKATAALDKRAEDDPSASE